MRRAIARRMSASKREAPHFYLSTDIEVDRAQDHVAAVGERIGARVTMTALLLRACVVSLKAHPRLNAVWEEDELMIREEVNVGVAIALNDGLVAPAVYEADASGLAAANGALKDLVARAREGRLRGGEMTEATFTLSNLGMFEVTSFIPIVTPPQVAILATGKSTKEVAFVDGELVERSRITATVSADHRALDGADVARFLGTLKATIEEPGAFDA